MPVAVQGMVAGGVAMHLLLSGLAAGAGVWVWAVAVLLAWSVCRTIQTEPLAALPLAVPLLFLPDYVFGEPSALRGAAVLGAAAAAAAVVVWANRPREDRAGAPASPAADPSTRSPRPAMAPPLASASAATTLREGAWLAAALLLFVVVTTALVLRKYAVYGDTTLATDLAYANQVLWTTWTSGFRTLLAGSVLQATLFDPPVTSHFALHNSPVLLMLAPIKALGPGLAPLLVLRNVVVALSAVPLYLLARQQLEPTASGVLAAAYLVSPTILYQNLHAFYDVQLALGLFLGCALAYCRDRMPLFLACAAALLLVREDLGLSLAAFTAVAVLERRPGHWIVVPALLGLGWWAFSIWVVMPAFAPNAAQSTLSLYAGWGASFGEAIARIVTSPREVAALVLGPERLEYLYRLIRGSGAVGVVSPLGLLAAPTIAVNLLPTRSAPSTIDLGSHYSAIAAAAFFAGTTVALGRWITRIGSPRSRRATAVAAALAVAAASTVATLDVVGRGELARYRWTPDVAALDRIVSAIPPEAAVAAPISLLPALSERAVLLSLNHLRNPRQLDAVEYVVADELPARISRPSGMEGVYESLLTALQRDPRYRALLRERGFVLYRRTAPPQETGSSGQARSNRPAPAGRGR